MDFIKLHRNSHDLSGRRFGRFVVMGPVRVKKNKASSTIFWLAKCDCGSEKVVRGPKMVDGTTSSCGCLRQNFSPWINKGSTTHGMSKTPEYLAWGAMRERCSIPTHAEFENYGGRGITVCEKWLGSFENFYSDMGPRPSKYHTIDRYPDNDGNYEPGNVRWATRKQQSNNTRKNRVITAFGRTAPLSSFINPKDSKLYYRARYRLSEGWNAEEALTKPPKRQFSGS